VLVGDVGAIDGAAVGAWVGAGVITRHTRSEI
jgi:hypothetical protein